MKICVQYDSKKYKDDNWYELVVIVSTEDRLGVMRVVGGQDGHMDTYGNLSRADWEEATRLGMGSKSYWSSVPDA